jgi:hypothetical protein
MTRIDHTTHAHDNTPSARQACRKLHPVQANGQRYGCDYCGGEITSRTPLTYNHVKGCPAMPKPASMNRDRDSIITRNHRLGRS